MNFRAIATGILSAAVVLGPVGRAGADGGDIAGGIIGGIVGGLIVNEGIKNQNRQRTVVRRSAVDSYTREQNRETQVALNYFGFPAGTPDGVLGRNSRTAIAQYQAFMGYPATGYLSDFERTQLVTSYNRAVLGGAQNAQLMAQYGQGPRGLLIAYRDEAAGIAPQAAQPAQPVQPAAEAPSALAAAPAAPATVPVFGLSGPQLSIASHCNRVSLVTNSNGGFTTVANMVDPGFTMGEQFCLARTYAISDGENLARQVQGANMAEIDAQCASFAQLLKGPLATLAVGSRDQVLAQVGEFIVGSGQPPAQLRPTARICLSSGYRTDSAEVALASALLLTGLGDAPYAELVGHHLANGFGTAERPDLAVAWFDAALSALENGATPVFAPGDPGRVQLLRAALVSQRASAAGSGAAAAPIPAFSLGGSN
ncbi:peptidoglycan-binding domain-containing protein [Albidovulum sp.]